MFFYFFKFWVDLIVFYDFDSLSDEFHCCISFFSGFFSWLLWVTVFYVFFHSFLLVWQLCEGFIFMMGSARNFSKDFFAGLMTWAYKMSSFHLVVSVICFAFKDFGDFSLIFSSDVEIVELPDVNARLRFGNRSFFSTSLVWEWQRPVYDQYRC